MLLQLPIGLEDKLEGVVDLIEMKAIRFAGKAGDDMEEGPIPDDMREEVASYREQLLDAVSMFSNELMEAILEDRITNDMIYQAIRKGTLELKLTPVMLGSAYKNVGVQLLLDAVIRYLPCPPDIKNEALELSKDIEETIELQSDPAQPTGAAGLQA